MVKSSSIRNGVLLGVLLVIGVLIGTRMDVFDRTPVAATVLDVPRALAEFKLVDHTEQTFSRDRFKGQWSLVFFGFTNCEGVCPMTLAKLSHVVAELRSPPAIIFVSVDPGRDSPQVLAKYVQSFGENLTGLTGKSSEIDKLTGSFFAPYSVSGEGVSGEGDSYNVDHSSSVFLVNPDGNFVALFSAPIDSNILVEDIRKII